MSQFGDDWDDWQEVLDNRYEAAIERLSDDYESHSTYQQESRIYQEEITWTPKFTYPRSFNNYDAWMAECYSKNQDGSIDYTKGVMARFAEKEALKVLRDRYKFKDVFDTNLAIAVEQKLKFSKHLLPYDISVSYQDQELEFDVKARISPQDSNFHLNLSKVQENEFFLFARINGTRTLPSAEIVGFLTPNMVADYFQHLNQEVATFPGYFLFNNSLEAFDAYREKGNPVEVPLRMQWVERCLTRYPEYTISKDLIYLVNEYQDYSNNQDVAAWKERVAKRIKG